MGKLAAVVSVITLLAGCGTCAACAGSTPESTPALTTATPPTPIYDVHEWGLLRGTADDGVMLSGPHSDPPAIALAKPVLYFHRAGDGPLTVDVSVVIPRGQIIEHWPLGETGGHPETITWPRVTVQAGTCPGARYPSPSEPPCTSVSDGCESAELATVETDDGDCLQTADGTAWNHLFYRGAIEGAPSLPLRLETLDDGRLRVTNTGTAQIAGRLLRLHHDGVGRTDAALVASPPSPGAQATLAVPAGRAQDAADALVESLRAAGLTDPEARAFRRSWDATLFGSGVVAEASAEAPPAATAMGASPAPAPWTSVVYVLPEATAETLATLQLSPPPRAVHRAIVAWIDEARP